MRPLGGGEAGSRSAPTGERQASSASEGNRALVTDTLMERIRDRKNLNRAYKRVKANRASPGVDGMTVGELGAWLAAPRESSSRACWTGATDPRRSEGLRSRSRVVGCGSWASPPVVDRLVQQAILQVSAGPTAGPDLFGVELRLSARTQRPPGVEEGVGVRGRRAHHCRGRGPREVLRPGQSRRADGTPGPKDRRQASAEDHPPVP